MNWTRESFAVVAVCLLGTIGLGIAYGDSVLPLSLLPPAALAGLVALGVCGMVVRKSRRPLTPIDLVRIASWVVLGMSCVTSQTAGSYYNYFWPQYGPPIRHLAMVVGVVALMTIVLTRLIYPPPAIKPGCCAKCGYDLTGNVSGVCPECGEKI
ncbi:MAG: hypothetical protein GX616_12175 [Planctomycetes bacterium]|nr:hypothetical protein [Planctomycetota bacterium]